MLVKVIVFGLLDYDDEDVGEVVLEIFVMWYEGEKVFDKVLLYMSMMKLDYKCFG